MPGSNNTSYFVDVMGVILVVELTYAKGLCNLWLKCDSILVIYLFHNTSPSLCWSLHNRLLGYHILLEEMEFCVSNS